MKLLACLLLLSGFFLVLASLALLPALELRFAFVAAGFGVEVLGLALLLQAYRSVPKEQR